MNVSHAKNNCNSNSILLVYLSSWFLLDSLSKSMAYWPSYKKSDLIKM